MLSSRGRWLLGAVHSWAGSVTGPWMACGQLECPVFLLLQRREREASRELA